MSTRQYSNYADLITFSRASGGTALRPVSYGDELVTNGTFDTDTTGWTALDSTLSVSSGELVITATTNGTAYATQTMTVEVGKTYVVSVDHKHGNINQDLLIGSTDGGAQLYNGPTLTADTTENITVVATTTLLSVRIRVFSTTIGQFGGADNISVKEVLFDQPAAPLTLFNHPANIPRIEYDADGNRLGLLIEEQRTNLVTYSDVDTTNWAGGDSANISTESVSNPFGFSSLVKVVPTTDTQGNASNRTVKKSINVTTGTTHTYSAFVKAAGYNAAYIIFIDRANVYGGVAYDLSTASLIELGGPNTGTLSNPFIEDFGDGWYRIGFSHDGGGAIDATNGVGVGFVPTGLDRTVEYTQSSFAGDGVSGGYVVGVQVEEGSFPTSYIPTLGSTATRAADVASIPVADFGYNQSEGTMFVEASTNSTAATNHNDLNIRSALGFRVISSGSRVGGSAEGTYSAYSPTTTVLVNKSSVITEGNTYKAAYAFADNDVALSVNGASVVTDTSTSITSLTATTVEIGYGYGYLNGHIKSINYYPRRLTNAQLQELTS